MRTAATEEDRRITPSRFGVTLNERRSGVSDCSWRGGNCRFAGAQGLETVAIVQMRLSDIIVLSHSGKRLSFLSVRRHGGRDGRGAQSLA
jgi:hypothetical protein